MEYKVVIDTTEYTDADIQSGNIERPLFDEFGIGNACMAMLKIVFKQKSTIPRMSKIVPQALVDGQWEQLGVFYLDERSVKPTGVMTVVAYDSMLKADKVWVPDQSLEFPMPMDDAVDTIAELIGITVDSRTQISHSYTIDYPANDYTLRDVLKFIAAANGGNWTITRENKLLFIPIAEEPTTVYQIGEKALSFTGYEKSPAVSGVILWADDENSYQAGNDTGTVVEADCPYATQEIADSVYASIQGYEYQGLEADGAKVTPIAELGDGITVHGVSSVLAYQNIRFSSGEVMDVAAPGSDETLHEYKTDGETTKKFNHQIAQTRSEITKTAEEINLKIEATDGRVSEVEQTVDGITLSVSQPIESGGQSYVEISLTVGQNTSKGYVRIDGNVDISGTLSAQALYAALGDIAQLTVDSLATSRRIPLYLAGDQGDDNYIRIQGQSIQFVTGSTAGATEQATDPTGAKLYWDQDVSDASLGSDGYPYVDGARVFTTTEQTSWPVMVYVYTEQIKREITFENIGGMYTPVDTFGAGDQNGRRKGTLIKGPTSMELMYTDALGNKIGVEMSDDGYTDVYGMRKPTEIDFSSWDSGSFKETIDGGEQNTYQVEFDSSGQPIKIKDSSGHETAVVW